MPNLLRSLTLGLVAGIALSAARAPLGLDLLAIPAVDAIDSAAYRAFALGAIALALGTRSTRALPSVAWVLAATAVGFALHGFLGFGLLEVQGFTGLVILVAVAAFAMGASAGPAAAPTEDDPPPASIPVQLGFVLAGAGAAVTLESLARPLRMLGLGTRADDTAFGCALLILLAIGAIAFRGLVDSDRRGRPSLAAGLALGCAAALYSVGVLEQFCSRMGLDAYLRISTWDLDTSHIGMLQAQLLLGGRTMLLPAFAMGAALCGARRSADLSRVLVGGAIGLLGLAATIGHTTGTEAELSLLTSERVGLGITIAALGGILTCASELRGRAPAAFIGLGLSISALVLPYVLPPRHVLPLSPWERFPPQPTLLEETPEGLLTVEPTPGGAEVLTLARRRLTPTATQLAADDQRLRLAWELLSDEQRGRGRVLIIGQLTPLRALTLSGLGARSIDRSAIWFASMPAVEAQLFDQLPLPEGRVLAPHEARSRITDGAYDLVLVPPVEGSPPVVELPDTDAVVCVWIGTEVHAAWRDWGERVLPSSSGLGELCLGLTNASPEATASAVTLSAGSPVPFGNEVTRLLMRPLERSIAARSLVGERLADASSGGASGQLASGLALHFAAQRRSSPWETDAQSVELDGESLRQLREGALAEREGGPRTFVRELWEGIAELVVEKREIELNYENLEPLLEAFGPWPALERALAAADMEMLEPGRAADRLLRVLEDSPYDLALRAACADALAAAGRPAEVVEQCRAALAVQPGRRDFERRLGAALVQSGDPEGRALIERLMREDPEDEELAVYLSPGPHPPLPPPAPFSHDGDLHDH